MTVKELIATLQTFDPELPVLAHGEDGNEPVSMVVFDERADYQPGHYEWTTREMTALRDGVEVTESVPWTKWVPGPSIPGVVLV